MRKQSKPLSLSQQNQPKILSRNLGAILCLTPNERSGAIIAIALASQSQRAGFPLTLQLGGVKLPKPSWVKINQIRTLAIKRLGRRMGRAREADLSKVIEGLFELVG